MKRTLEILSAMEDKGVMSAQAPRSRSEMGTMDNLNPEVGRIIAAKEARRRRLARLPFAEKVKAVVQLQRMAAPLLQRQGRRVKVWEIQEGGRP